MSPPAHSGGEVVPAYNLRGTASYYKMPPLPGPTPLLQNAVGFLMGHQWPMSAHYKKVRGQSKPLPFLNFHFVWCEAHMLLDEFRLQ